MVEEHRFPCEACGADMRFEPAAGMLVCGHCGTREPLGNLRTSQPVIRELDFDSAIRQRLPELDIEETRTFSCTSCGAIVEFDPDTHSAECPFCASPIVTSPAINRHIRPGGLLPFFVEEPKAHQAVAEWLGNRWFAPNGLAEYARKGRRMSGIYVPFWTFDADTTTDYRGQRGTVHTESRTVIRNGKPQRTTVTKVRWRPARGRVSRAFDDVLVLASNTLPRRHTDALPPWDLSRLVPYAPEYLAGFRAEAYRIELREAWGQAREVMDRRITRDVRFDIGGDRQRIDSMNTRISDVTFKHVLLPVWVAAYKFRGKSYRIVVNGQTGRVEGERPWSIWKLGAAVLCGLIAATIAAFVIALAEQY